MQNRNLQAEMTSRLNLPNIYGRNNTDYTKAFKNIEKQGTLPNSFNEVSIIMIPKTDKDILKLHTSTPH